MKQKKKAKKKSNVKDENWVQKNWIISLIVVVATVFAAVYPIYSSIKTKREREIREKPILFFNLKQNKFYIRSLSTTDYVVYLDSMQVSVENYGKRSADNLGMDLYIIDTVSNEYYFYDLNPNSKFEFNPGDILDWWIVIPTRFVFPRSNFLLIDFHYYDNVLEDDIREQQYRQLTFLPNSKEWNLTTANQNAISTMERVISNGKKHYIFGDE